MITATNIEGRIVWGGADSDGARRIYDDYWDTMHRVAAQAEDRFPYRSFWDEGEELPAVAAAREKFRAELIEAVASSFFRFRDESGLEYYRTPRGSIMLAPADFFVLDGGEIDGVSVDRYRVYFATRE